MANLPDGIGVGDFALKLLEQEEEKGLLPDPNFSSKAPEGVTQPTPSYPGELKQQAPDVRTVKVTKQDVNTVLAEAFGIEVEPVDEVPKEETLLEERKRQLKEEFFATADRLRDLIKEMTTVGMLGVNLGGPGYGSNKSNKKRRRKTSSRK